MGIPVLILGKSGSGKSASLRNVKPGEIGIVNVLGKPLPFKSKHKYVVTDSYTRIKDVLGRAKVSSLIIDDAGYLITSEFMRRGSEKGYTKFTEMANNFYELISFIQFDMPEDSIVYMVMHEEESEALGIVKPKTIGKLLDEKVCVEGLFTIVLRCMRTEDRYIFRTATNGYDVTKTPIGLFEKEEIDNDLVFVDKKIREYYEIEKK